MDPSNSNLPYSQFAKLVPISFGSHSGGLQPPVYIPGFHHKLNYLPSTLRDTRGVVPNTFQRLNPSENLFFLLTPSSNCTNQIQEESLIPSIPDNSPIIPEIAKPSVCSSEPLLDKEKSKEEKLSTNSVNKKDKGTVNKPVDNSEKSNNTKTIAEKSKALNLLKTIKNACESKEKGNNVTREHQENVRQKEDKSTSTSVLSLENSSESIPRFQQEDTSANPKENNTTSVNIESSIDIVNNDSVHLSISIEKEEVNNASAKSKEGQNTTKKDSQDNESSSLISFPEKSIKQERQDEDLSSDNSIGNSSETYDTESRILSKSTQGNEDSDVQIVYEKIVMYVKKRKKHHRERKRKRELSNTACQTHPIEVSPQFDIHPIKLKKHRRGRQTIWSSTQQEVPADSKRQGNPPNNKRSLVDAFDQYIPDIFPEIKTEEMTDYPERFQDEIYKPRSSQERHFKKSSSRKTQGETKRRRRYSGDEEEDSSRRRRRLCKFQRSRRAFRVTETTRITRSLSAKLEKR